MAHYSFKRRVLALAVLLVAGVQLLTLFPVLRTIKNDVDKGARETVKVAATVFDEVTRAREEQLLTTVGVLIADFGFKQAVATRETDTIRSALSNHGARIGADISLLLDLDGQIIASSAPLAGDWERSALNGLLANESSAAADQVALINGVAYQTVTVPVRAPIVVAWVVMGFRIDAAMAARLQSLTGLEVSFVGWKDGAVNILASTLAADRRGEALRAMPPVAAGGAQSPSDLTAGAYLTQLRPFLRGSPAVSAALQLSLHDAMASYRDVRLILLMITSLSLLVAVGCAFWLARTVTQPVSNLAAAARRMREGVYSETIASDAAAEFRDLADSFNAMQQAIAEREERILHQASHDSLSGLPNRQLVVSRLNSLMAAAESFCLLNLVITRFNRIASTLGHRTGDELIKLAARVLADNLQEGCFLGHLGGNQFVVILDGPDVADAADWAGKINHLLEAGVTVRNANIALRVTVGIAQSPDSPEDPEELLRHASIARSDAELAQESVAHYQAGQEAYYLRQIRVLGDFPRALRENQLRLCFQPKINCQTGEVVGAEALVRWQHPELGLLMPFDFVDAIEQAGSIAHLSRWVIREAVNCCADWRKRGLSIKIAANLSVDDLLDEYLPYYLLQVVNEGALKPADLTLEVTESSIMRNVAQASMVIDCIREIGFRVSIDDFGTGHSSLAQLTRLPVAELKIDKSFVMSMYDGKNMAIVRSTVELAHQLGLDVVAEGVESDQALSDLRAMGCEFAQGFFISRPVPAAEFCGWAEQYSADNGPGGHAANLGHSAA